jgi:hypothetical protein
VLEGKVWSGVVWATGLPGSEKCRRL